MFKCKACVCKDAHIKDLQKTVEFLKHQLQPTPSLPTVNLEANFALDGAGREEINVYDSQETSDSKIAQDRIEAEATAILSGDYEHLGDLQ